MINHALTTDCYLPAAAAAVAAVVCQMLLHQIHSRHHRMLVGCWRRQEPRKRLWYCHQTHQTHQHHQKLHHLLRHPQTHWTAQTLALLLAAQKQALTGPLQHHRRLTTVTQPAQMQLPAQSHSTAQKQQ
jgi:hypothetical protein